MFKTSLDVEIAVEIERPASEVWAVVEDFERTPEWVEEFVDAVQETEPPLQVGSLSRYTVDPGHRSGTMVIVELDPGRRLAWDGPPLSYLGGATRPRGSHEVVPLGEQRARLVSRYRPELTGTMALIRPLLGRWLRRTRTADAQKLKRIVEGRD